MTVTPIPGEPDRFFVSSDTDNELWLVDLHPGPDLPRCACAIHYNRTALDWRCKHIRAVLLRTTRRTPSVPQSWHD